MLFLDRLLLLLLLLAESVHLLGPGVICVLWLKLLLLLEARLLRLLLLRLLVSVAAEPVLETSLLRLLHARRLRLVVRIVQEASMLRLLLLNGVAEPIHRSLLLVALVETRGLRSLRRGIVEEQIGLVLVVPLTLPQLLLLLTELERFCKIIVVVFCALRPPVLCFLGFVLACFERQSVFEIIVVLVCACALSVLPAGLCGLALVAAHRAHIFKTGNARLPRAAVRALGAKAFFVHDE